jgi:hypothetical protein
LKHYKKYAGVLFCAIFNSDYSTYRHEIQYVKFMGNIIEVYYVHKTVHLFKTYFIEEIIFTFQMYIYRNLEVRIYVNKHGRPANLFELGENISYLKAEQLNLIVFKRVKLF